MTNKQQYVELCLYKKIQEMKGEEPVVQHSCESYLLHLALLFLLVYSYVQVWLDYSNSRHLVFVLMLHSEEI